MMAHGMNLGHAGLTAWGLAAVDLVEPAVVLDIGCGGGRTIRRLASMAPRGKVVGIDYSPDSLAVARRTARRRVSEGRVDLILGTVSHLPFRDAAFDLVTAIESHFFWPDLASDLAEVRRVLKPGARVVIISAMYRGSRFDRRNRRIVEAGKMSWLSVEEYEELLGRAGFTDVDVAVEERRGWIRAMGKGSS
jgi:ubiquinone/menaquinone biosynthesis C-methylase UbiE